MYKKSRSGVLPRQSFRLTPKHHLIVQQRIASDKAKQVSLVFQRLQSGLIADKSEREQSLF